METITEKEFVDNAVKLLTKDFDMTKEEAEAMTYLTVILGITCRESSLFNKT